MPCHKSTSPVLNKFVFNTGSSTTKWTKLNCYCVFFMQVIFCLKVILKSWDRIILGTKISFHEIFTVRPLFDPMSVTLSFNLFSKFSSKFCWIFLLILSLKESINAWNDSWFNRSNNLFGFTVLLQFFFSNSEKWVFKCVKFFFIGVAKPCKIT